jgi:hypothetical protein
LSSGSNRVIASFLFGYWSNTMRLDASVITIAYMEILLSPGSTCIEFVYQTAHFLGFWEGVAVMDCQRVCKKSNTGLEALIDPAVALSGVKSNDHIVITGHKALGVLMGLCRRGFVQATCQRAVGGLHRRNCADSLWILNSHDAGELRTLIAECVADLRIAGTLVIGLRPSTAVNGAAQFRAVLAKCGFHCESEIGVGGQVILLCARKEERKALAA